MSTRPPRLTEDDLRLKRFRPGQLTSETAAEIESHRQFYAKKRAERAAAAQQLPEGPASNTLDDNWTGPL